MEYRHIHLEFEFLGSQLLNGRNEPFCKEQNMKQITLLIFSILMVAQAWAQPGTEPEEILFMEPDSVGIPKAIFGRLTPQELETDSVTVDLENEIFTASWWVNREQLSQKSRMALAGFYQSLNLEEVFDTTPGGNGGSIVTGGSGTAFCLKSFEVADQLEVSLVIFNCDRNTSPENKVISKIRIAGATVLDHSGGAVEAALPYVLSKKLNFDQITFIPALYLECRSYSPKPGHFEFPGMRLKECEYRINFNQFSNIRLQNLKK